jgi:hypothetical protein
MRLILRPRGQHWDDGLLAYKLEPDPTESERSACIKLAAMSYFRELKYCRIGRRPPCPECLANASASLIY